MRRRGRCYGCWVAMGGPAQERARGKRRRDFRKSGQERYRNRVLQAWEAQQPEAQA